MQTRTISSCWTQFPHIQPFQRICPPSSPADSIPMQLCQDFGLPKLHGNHISSSTFGSEICVLLEKNSKPWLWTFHNLHMVHPCSQKPSGTLEHFSHLSILANPSLPVPNQTKSGRSEGVSHVLRHKKTKQPETTICTPGIFQTQAIRGSSDDGHFSF